MLSPSPIEVLERSSLGCSVRADYDSRAAGTRFVSFYTLKCLRSPADRVRNTDLSAWTRSMKNSIHFAVARSLSDDASINYSNLSSGLGPGGFQPLEAPNKGGELLVMEERNASRPERFSPSWLVVVSWRKNWYRFHALVLLVIEGRVLGQCWRDNEDVD